MAKQESKVLYRKTVDVAAGVLEDIRERESRTGNVYLELVFADGTFIQMPAGFRIPFDLVQGGEYSARWEDGKFYIAEGLGGVEVPAEVKSEDLPY